MKLTQTFMYQVIGFTDCGKVRSVNEDSYFFKQKSDEQHQSILFAAVADGIGGMFHGEQASQIVIQALDDWWENQLPLLLPHQNQSEQLFEQIELSLDNYIRMAHLKIYRQTQKMGTTLSAILIFNNQYLLKHAGDSRIYFWGENGLEQKTTDHTWYQYECEQGTLDLQQVSIPKMQSVLLNAIGGKPEYILERKSGSLDTIRSVLLCSDGIYKYLPSSEMEKILKSVGTLKNKGRKIKKILQRSEARDNYTAILIQRKKAGEKFANLWKRR